MTLKTLVIRNLKQKGGVFLNKVEKICYHNTKSISELSSREKLYRIDNIAAEVVGAVLKKQSIVNNIKNNETIALECLDILDHTKTRIQKHLRVNLNVLQKNVLPDPDELNSILGCCQIYKNNNTEDKKDINLKVQQQC